MVFGFWSSSASLSAGIRRCRWRRRAENVLQNPLAANDGRRSLSLRRDRENAPLAQQSPPCVIDDRHTPELAAVDPGYAVVLREALVDEGVIGSQQVEHVAVAADDALEEQIRFSSKRLAEVVIEVGEDFRIRRHGPDVTQLQPLSGEVGDQRV